MEIKIIENYILYLIGECRLSVTLHPMSDETLITGSSLANSNIHDNPYCSYIKSLPDGHTYCLLQQKKVFRRCCKQSESFSGTCFAGVREYVYPICNGKKTAGFISVSSYASDQRDAYISAVTKQLDCSPDRLLRQYGRLKAKMPDKRRIDTLILPLCKMLELAYLEEERDKEKDTPCEAICRYIHRHYSVNITTDLLCERFSCSKSYFSHNFKKHTGKSLRDYLTDIRLNYAKQLLEHSNLSVPQIAFSVGFNDSNYFSNVFKQKTGLSPLLYRKTKRKTAQF